MNEYILQSKNTFIRNYSDFGYITNQVTKHDRVYNHAGALLLKIIDRTPKKINDVIHKIYQQFIDVDFDTVKNDFSEIISDLEKDKYVITGNTPLELEKKDIGFSYCMENPKTFVFDFFDNDRKGLSKDTSEYFYEKFHENPQILGFQVELTSRCNERCVHCYIPHENKLIDIETKFAFNVFDQLKEMGTLNISLSGGECLIHKDFIDILYKARECDFAITVLSNLTLLNDDIIAALTDVNINGVQVSVYSMNPDEHDAITKFPGSYNKTITAIEKLFSADIPVQISCPVMKINRKSYKKVLEWAYQHKMKAYTDFIMMAKTNFDISNLENRISIEETAELINDIIEVDDDYRTILEERPPKSKDMEKYLKQPICGVAVDNICMVANGDFYPCSGWQGYVVGNAYKQSVKDIWENSEQLKYLRTITNASFPKCVSCEANDYCAMCMVRNYNESKGDIFKINDHFCKSAFLNKKLAEDYKLSKCNGK